MCFAYRFIRKDNRQGRLVSPAGSPVSLILILLTLMILLGAGTYYGYQAGYYGIRQFGGGIVLILVVVLMCFLISSTD